MAQIRGAIFIWRWANCDEEQITCVDCCRQIRSELKIAGGDIVYDKFLKPRLVYRNLALLQALNFGKIYIHAQHLVANFCQTGPSNQAHIAIAENRNLHRFYLISLNQNFSLNLLQAMTSNVNSRVRKNCDSAGGGRSRLGCWLVYALSKTRLR